MQIFTQRENAQQQVLVRRCVKYDKRVQQLKVSLIKLQIKLKRKKQRKDNSMPGYGYGKMSKKMTKKPMKKKVRIVMGNKNTKSKKRKA